jgi:hypothetical protein
MSETFDYHDLDRDGINEAKKILGFRDMLDEYSILVTHVSDNRKVYSALVLDDSPFNPLTEWMTDIEIVTNERGRNSLQTDDERTFNRESGIVDMEDFPDWRWYDIDLWSDDNGDDIEERATFKFPEIDDATFGTSDEVGFEDIDKYVASLRELQDSLAPNEQIARDNLNGYIKDILKHKEYIAPNPHVLVSHFDGGYGYGYIDCVVIPSDSLVDEFLNKSVFNAEEAPQKLQDYLKGCLKTYSQWATGDVYGYVQKVIIDGEEAYEDSCWGYYGHDGAKEELKSVHEYTVASQEKKKQYLDEIRAMFLPESELVNG